MGRKTNRMIKMMMMMIKYFRKMVRRFRLSLLNLIDKGSFKSIKFCKINYISLYTLKLIDFTFYPDRDTIKIYLLLAVVNLRNKYRSGSLFKFSFQGKENYLYRALEIDILYGLFSYHLGYEYHFAFEKCTLFWSRIINRKGLLITKPEKLKWEESDLRGVLLCKFFELERCEDHTYVLISEEYGVWKHFYSSAEAKDYAQKVVDEHDYSIPVWLQK